MRHFSTAPPFFGGTLLVSGIFWALPEGLGGTPGVAGQGSSSTPFAIPGNAGLAGASIYVQAGYVDAGAAQGVSLTNGLRIGLGVSP